MPSKSKRRPRSTKKPKQWLVPVAGMPRSGSTLLTELLNQNPAFHVTATNNLCNLLVQARNTWQTMEGFRSQGLWDHVQPRVARMLKSMPAEFYAPERKAGKIVFDKDRGWISQLPLLDALLGVEAKLIATVRDPRDAFASFEKLYRADPIAQPNVPASEPSQYGRADVMFRVDGIIGGWINGFRDAGRNPTYGGRICLVTFEDLTTKPAEVMQEIEEFMGLPSFDYDFENIEQSIEQDDVHHGFKNLHKVGRKVTPARRGGWKKVLDPRTANAIAAKFQDIIDIAAGTSSDAIDKSGTDEFSKVADDVAGGGQGE